MEEEGTTEDVHMVTFMTTCDDLAKLGETYRRSYFGKRLSNVEIYRARATVVDIRNTTGYLMEHWAAFRHSRQHASTFWTIVGSPRLLLDSVRQVIRDLVSVSSVGSQALHSLDQLAVYTLHYERQTRTMDEEEDKKRLEEDALELNAWVEQAARQLRDEVTSTHAQIELASLYSQTLLTSQISSLNRALVLLTGVVIAVSVVAAVAGMVTLVG